MSKAAKAAKLSRSNSRFAGIGIVLLIVALLALMAAPAFAQHKADHENGGGQASQSSSASDHDGDADSDENTAYTEDNDTNDGGTPNNVEDDGDNAHPSGKDRSVENGGSGNQGKSESDPDDDGRGPDRTNGGPDKPNGSGGVDKADQDGNNGCGNDDDFEDDNEGWCGRKPKPVTTNEVLPEIVEKSVCPAGTDKAGQEMADLKDCDKDDVLGRIDESNPKVKRPDTVLGTMIRNSGPAVAAAAVAPAAQGAVLPFTGADLSLYAGIAAALILLGMVALRVRSES